MYESASLYHFDLRLEVSMLTQVCHFQEHHVVPIAYGLNLDGGAGFLKVTELLRLTLTFSPDSVERNKGSYGKTNKHSR